VADLAVAIKAIEELEKWREEAKDEFSIINGRVDNLEKALSWFKGAAWVAIGLLGFCASGIAVLVYDFLKWGFSTGFNWSK
jgi:hypothetical protein